MAGKKARPLTRLELEIMQVVWGKDEVTVEQIQRELRERDRPLALPSIRTMLSILQQKGYVTRRRLSHAYHYRALVSADKARKRILKDILDRAFDGSALDLVAALVKADMVSEEELEQISKLIGEHDRGAKK